MKIEVLWKKGLLGSEAAQTDLPGLVCGDHYFTQREKIILFQLIRGKSARTIADMLNRSKRTIESHIESLKLKTDSSAKAELIEKIMDKLLMNDANTASYLNPVMDRLTKDSI